MSEASGPRDGGRGSAAAPGPARPALAAALVLGLAACWGNAEPELLRRHAAWEVADTSGVVGVSVFSVPAAADASSPRLPELSSSAQAAFVRAVADRTETSGALLRTLGGPIGAPAGRGAMLDRTRFRRRVVVSAENRAARPARDQGGRWRASPGARISRLRVALGLDPSRAEFRSWDRFASRWESVDLGAMSFRREVRAGLGVELSPEIVAREVDLLGLEAGRTSTVDEELPLRRRYVSTGMLRRDSMVLLQEGAVGIDLTGNVVVQVDVDVRDAPEPARTHAFAGLFGDDGSPRPADAVRVASRDLVHAPGPVGDLRGSLRFEAVVRTVRSGAGDATWAEGDDHVRYLVEAAEAPDVVLVRASELRASVWQLATSGCRAFLHVEDDAGRPAVVQLASAEEAFALLRWLRRSGSGEVGRRTLYLGPDRGLAPGGADGLAVRLLPLNWSAGEPAPCP